MATRFKGNNAVTTTGRSRFWVYVDFEAKNLTATKCDVYVTYGIYVDMGDFYNSHVKTTWGKNGAIGKVGYYLTKGPVKLGTFAYGAVAKASASAQYTAYNGSVPKSSVSASWTVPFQAASAPAAPAGVAATRKSDTQCQVSWTVKATGTAPYQSQAVQRSTDGGSWMNLKSGLSGSASSYTDTSVSAGHTYQYRVVAKNAKGSSYSAASSKISNTPTAPSGVKVSATGKNTATITVSGKCGSATGIEWQYEANGVLSAVMAASSLTSISVDGLGGTVRFRTRFTNGSLKGPWSAWSDYVLFETAPAAPTLTAPVSSSAAVFSEAIEFSWNHNPRDGSAQTAAQVRWTLDEEWTVIDVAGPENTLVIENQFPNNSAVVWSVRTKGASDDWGDWAGNRVFYIRKHPVVSVESPTSLIDSIPFEVNLSYNDESGDVADVAIKIEDSDGIVSFEKELGASISCTIDRGEWVPQEDVEYTLTASCRSTSGLSADCSTIFTVHFIDPKHVDAFVSFDDETGEASILVSVDQESEGSDIEAVELWRVSGGGERLLAPALLDGGEYSDRWAPLNRTFVYRLVVYAESGAIRTFERETRIDSSWAYFYYGQEWSLVARGMWELDESYSVSRPGKNLVRYAGRDYPVLYDSGHVSDRRSFSAVIEGEDILRFDEMARSYGCCIAKTIHGDVLCAAVEVSVSEHSTLPFEFQTASVTFERIEGDWE